MATKAVTDLVKNVAGEFEGKRTLKECYDIMTAKGQAHEMRDEVINGIVQRVYVNAPPTLRHIWLSVAAHGDKPYLIYQNERYTYAESLQRVAVIAHALIHEFGVKKGDKVAISMRNMPEWVLVFWAVEMIGAVSVAVNAWLPTPAMSYVIRKAKTKVLIVDSERADRLVSISKELEAAGVQSTAVVRPDKHFSGMMPFEDLVAKYDKPEYRQLPPVDLGPEDIACIFCTSGTTGLPKLVISTHRQFVTNLLNGFASIQRTALRRGEDIPVPDPSLPQKGFLVSVPFFHVTGNQSLLQLATATGSKVVMMHKWSVDEAVRLIKTEKLTAAGGVPGMAFEIIVSELSNGPNTIESLMYGGAPAPGSMVGQAAERMPAASLSQGYGLTETNALAVGFSGEDYVARPTSTGLPTPNCDIRIMCPDKLVEKPVGEVGEIWIKGCNVALGYYDDEEATRKSFTKDHWFRSGDLGYVDTEGFVYISDRAKDIIIRGGENITSIVVENAIYSDSRVLDAAVVPVPDHLLGELVAAVVSPKPEFVGKITEKEIQDVCRKLLPKHEVPVMVDIREEPIERNANGKIVKKDLKQLVAKLWELRKKSKL